MILQRILAKACINGDFQMVKLLLDGGVAVNAQDSVSLNNTTTLNL